MDYLYLISVILVVLSIIESKVAADRTNNKIYININGNSACFRRMNATHQIGCASGRGGNVGVVHYISSQQDIEWLRDKGPNPPYAALLTPTMFTKEHVKALQATNKINSLLVIFTNNTGQPAYFSADATCPNDRYGLYAGNMEYAGCQYQTWNPHGSGFMFTDFPFPIMALTNDTEIDILITQCYEKFNKPGVNGEARLYPLCSAQVKDEMDAAKDTPTCIRRSNLLQGLNPERYCDPLGNFNTFAFTRPITFDNPIKNKSLIIAAARLDGFSMFNEIYTNSEGTVSGIVTLLGAAYAIGKVKDTLSADHKPIMFAFFNGEAYDYIGSSRTVYEMKKNTFPTTQQHKPKDKDAAQPIPLSSIHSFVEVSQVGKPNTPGEVFLHRDPLSTDIGSKIDDMVNKLQAAGSASDLTVRTTPPNQPLPSASLQTFLKNHNHIPGIVIADHEKEFTNPYYNSRFDVPSVMNADYPKDIPENETYDYVTEAAAHLQKVSTTLARALYTMSTDSKDTANITVDNVTIANLLNCYLHNGDCELFRQVDEPDRPFGKHILSYYTGVSTSFIGPHNVTRYTKRTLAYFLGDQTNTTKKECTAMEKHDEVYTYIYAGGPLNSTGSRTGFCVKSTANLSLARSPAFDIDGYDWNSGQYSSWTESQWQFDAMSLRIFLVPSRQREISTLCIGLGLFLFSIVTTYLLHKRAPVMFRPLRTAL